MTQREYVYAAIRHEQTEAVPYTLGFEGGTDKELDAFYGSTDWRNTLSNYLTGVASIDTLGQEKIDETYARDAFGSIWRMDRRPWHLEKPILQDARDLSLIDWPVPTDFELKVIGKTADGGENRSDAFGICHCGWGLFEHGWRIRGFNNIMVDCIEDPDFYEELLDKLKDLYIGHVRRFADIPADGIMFGDDWGDQRGVIIGPERWRKLIKPRWAEIYAEVHRQGKLAMSHCCGSIVDIIPDIIEIGLDVLESVQPEPRGMDSFELKRKFGDKITFWGCLGSQSTVAFGTPREIKRRVADLCENMGKNGGYILAPAKSIQPGTPPENMAAVVESFSTQRPA